MCILWKEGVDAEEWQLRSGDVVIQQMMLGELGLHRQKEVPDGLNTKFKSKMVNSCMKL